MNELYEHQVAVSKPLMQGLVEQCAGCSTQHTCEAFIFWCCLCLPLTSLFVQLLQRLSCLPVMSSGWYQQKRTLSSSQDWHLSKRCLPLSLGMHAIWLQHLTGGAAAVTTPATDTTPHQAIIVVTNSPSLVLQGFHGLL
jgi:hypothetical protein